MYVLELLDNWAKLQERKEERKPEKSIFEKDYYEKEGSRKPIKQQELSRNSTIKPDESRFKKSAQQI
ncbi:MAG: hypothetical protein QW279_03320 [Candidatus Jordarchaeaceae archaeon]